jgi:hypothetical protein
MVLVQFRVTVPDVERFRAACEKWYPTFEQDGARNQQVWNSESNPSEVTTLTEWESHDQMMESSDRWGDPFQEDAGTVGLEWETRIWHRVL